MDCKPGPGDAIEFNAYRSGLFGTAVLAAWSYLLLLRFIYYASHRRAKARPPDSRGQSID
ncbi:hypothetical protein EMIT0194MI4_50480 [Pseudomonas sp. IT-194MI4]